MPSHCLWLNLVLVLPLFLLAFMPGVQFSAQDDISGRAPSVVVRTPLKDTNAIPAGNFHMCAMSMSGGVMCWGQNGDGQLGDGTSLEQTTPVDVIFVHTRVYLPTVQHW